MTIVVAPCVRCGHGPEEHRIRAEKREVWDVGFVFPCVVEGCDCEDYVDEPLRRTKKASRS